MELHNMKGNTMESNTKKFVRIRLSHPGYCVPADRKDMISTAVDALYEDVVNAVKHDEIDEWIDIVDTDATEKDIPSFITELYDDEENCLQ
jgi:hypothetical protein